MNTLSVLRGIRILDFTQILSGPFATMLLADAGAEVVKLERPDGDPTRHWGPPFIGGESVYFAAFNRGKKSVQLDLKRPDDLGIVRQLALAADVLIENIRPGSLEKYGLGAAELRKVHPGLIYVSIRGYSEFSRRANDPGLEVMLEAESGLMSITGPGEDGMPVRLGVAAIDMMTGLLAVSCVYSALLQRERTGEGAYISVSLEETAALLMTHPWLMYLAGNVEYKAAGTEHPNIAPYEMFSTMDRPLILGAVDDQQFRRLAHALGHPEWPQKSEWATNEARVADRRHLHESIEKELVTRTAEHWKNTFTRANLPVAIVESVSSAATKWAMSKVPRITARHPTMGLLSWPTSPWKKYGGEMTGPPVLGNATDEVLRTWLEGR
ncbi:CaiB/BaiF CoA transferase family protein [Kyrpidia spormannii]|uniref:CaiB/BaiF CoA transferase family protein n=1 Tax=Kyrpidia spormannii TaxID=2055160 RepID=UPI0022AA2344|nr:CoA transferase [Kyrpidia spormannii]